MKMSDNEPNETNDDDEFERITSGQFEAAPDEANPSATAKSLWEDFSAAWAKSHPGILTKGFVIAEFVGPEGRALKWFSSSGMAEWDILGLLHSVLLSIQGQNMAESLTYGYEEEEEAEDDD